MLNGPFRIAVDIGGTFTDLQILEETSDRERSPKTRRRSAIRSAR
jgi:N-methylhydantoinase A/oxoprolinase/acetone carboxylase beta subunit